MTISTSRETLPPSVACHAGLARTSQNQTLIIVMLRLVEGFAKDGSRIDAGCGLAVAFAFCLCRVRLLHPRIQPGLHSIRALAHMLCKFVRNSSIEASDTSVVSQPWWNWSVQYVHFECDVKRHVRFPSRTTTTTRTVESCTQEVRATDFCVRPIELSFLAITRWIP